MIKKIGLTLITLMVTLVLSTSVMAAPEGKGKGKPDNGKGPDVNGVIVKKDGEAINTGKSDEKPGPSPT